MGCSSELPRGLREMFSMTNVHRELEQQQFWIDEENWAGAGGCEPRALVLGIKIHTDSGKEMQSPDILCGPRLHPVVEEQTGVSVE